MNNLNLSKSISELDRNKILTEFLNSTLVEYTNELDALIIKINQNKSSINNNLFSKLKQMNDSIVLGAETTSRNIENPILLKKFKEFFRGTRPEYFYSSEIMEKGLKKLRGYPGDFEMMEYVYNNKVCSSSILGKYFDKYFIENAYAEAVRGRKDKMVELLIKFIDNSNTTGLSILNLPCGPARDVYELIEKGFKNKNSISITCVDQDTDALAFANKNISFSPSNLRINFKQGNILNYIRYPEKNRAELGVFNLVYSVGLADYLPDKLLKNMIKFSFGLLRKDGRLIFAFKIEDKDPFAPLPPKWFCDWEFVPRNLNASKKIISESGIENFELEKEEFEKSGKIVFLTVIKTK